MLKKLLSILLIVLVLIGCSSQKYSETPGNGSVGPEPAPSEPMLPSDPDKGQSDGGSQDPSFGEGTIDKSTDKKKIITTIFYNLESKTFDDDLEKLNSTAKLLGGAIKSINITGNKQTEYDSSSRVVYAVYHINQDKLDEFLEVFKGMSIINQSMTSEDVSKTYSDNKLKIESLETQHARLIELIAQAETLESIIILESRLSELELEINRLTGQNLDIEDLSRNVTITITMYEISETGRLTTETSFGARIQEAFNNMLSNLSNGFQSFVVDIVYNLPFLIFTAVGLVVLLAIFKAVSKKYPLDRVIKHEEKNKDDQ